MKLFDKQKNKGDLQEMNSKQNRLKLFYGKCSALIEIVLFK